MYKVRFTDIELPSECYEKSLVDFLSDLESEYDDGVFEILQSQVKKLIGINARLLEFLLSKGILTPEEVLLTFDPAIFMLSDIREQKIEIIKDETA